MRENSLLFLKSCSAFFAQEVLESANSFHLFPLLDGNYPDLREVLEILPLAEEISNFFWSLFALNPAALIFASNFSTVAKCCS